MNKKLNQYGEAYKNGVESIRNNELLMAKHEFTFAANIMLELSLYKKGIEKASLLRKAKQLYRIAGFIR